MSRFDRKKIAVTLAFASLFGNKTSSMNSNINTKSANKAGFSTEKNLKSGAEIPKPLGTLNIRNDSSGNKIFNWVKNHKAVSVVASLGVIGVVGLAIWGIKHKSKDNQAPKKDQQDPEKDPNEQVPPKDNDDNKENLSPNKLSNNPNPALPQQQQIQRYISFASQYVGQCNASNFAKAVVQFNDDNPDKKLQSSDISRFLMCFGAIFPAILNRETSFSSLAGLKKQQNVNFRFGKNKFSRLFGGFSCYVYIGDYIYEVYAYGGTDNINTDICKYDNQNQIMGKIKIVNMKVQRSQ